MLLVAVDYFFKDNVAVIMLQYLLNNNEVGEYWIDDRSNNDQWL